MYVSLLMPWALSNPSLLYIVMENSACGKYDFVFMHVLTIFCMYGKKVGYVIMVCGKFNLPGHIDVPTLSFFVSVSI